MAPFKTLGPLPLQAKYVAEQQRQNNARIALYVELWRLLADFPK